MRASDFLAIAREKLQGKWKKSILIMLLATLLGGWAGTRMPGIYQWYERLMDFHFGYKMASLIGFTEDTIRQLTDAAVRWFVPPALQGIYVLLLGAWVHFGVMRAGMAVLDGEEPRAGMLFTRGFYGKAVGLHIMRSLLMTLWSLALAAPVVIVLTWLDSDHLLPTSRWYGC